VRLIVVRHGETLFNVQGRFTGQMDVPLSTLGEQQAEALGRRLSTARLDVIVASDLQRARATALAIARHHGLPVEEDADLREMAFGSWEGATYAEVVARDEALVQRWQADPTVSAPPGGETVTQLHERVVRALERWRGRYPRGTVLWAVHGGVIEVLLCHLLGVDLHRRWEFRHDNASITEVELEGKEAVVVRLGETDHLLL
jgi:2,3-bisphosphoglycerate-dependent phosphoglycerate mutase